MKKALYRTTRIFKHQRPGGELSESEQRYRFLVESQLYGLLRAQAKLTQSVWVDNKAQLRRWHRIISPIMLMPILLTLITGSLYQVATLRGKGDDFLWLLELHRGRFGSINLEVIYPFLIAFGLLVLTTTGIILWFQVGHPARRS